MSASQQLCCSSLGTNLRIHAVLQPQLLSLCRGCGGRQLILSPAAAGRNVLRPFRRGAPMSILQIGFVVRRFCPSDCLSVELRGSARMGTFWRCRPDWRVACCATHRQLGGARIIRQKLAEAQITAGPRSSETAFGRSFYYRPFAAALPSGIQERR